MVKETCVAGGVHGRGHGGHAWHERRPLQRTVRILLECILVLVMLSCKVFSPLDFMVVYKRWSLHEVRKLDWCLTCPVRKYVVLLFGRQQFENRVSYLCSKLLSKCRTR